MQVTAWHSGASTYGIRIGKHNRDKYFNSKWKAIEVEIDGRIQRFVLTAGFWHQCPEIRDRGAPIIREWLQRHHLSKWAFGHPPKVELLFLGQGRFRLVPKSPNGRGIAT